MKTNKMSTGKNVPTSYLWNSETNRPFAVGDLLNANKTSLPEGVHYNYSSNGHYLHLSYNNPSAAEIRCVTNGEIDLALYIEKDIVDLVFSFGKGTPWADAPYSWHRNPSETRVIPPALENGSVIPLHIFLVDASTGIIMALRTILLSYEFTSELFAAIHAQTQMPYDVTVYDEHVDSMYRKFSPRDLVFRSRAKMMVPPQRDN